MGFSIAHSDLSSHRESREGRGICSRAKRAAVRVQEEVGRSRAKPSWLRETLAVHSNMSRWVFRLMWNFQIQKFKYEENES